MTPARLFLLIQALCGNSAATIPALLAMLASVKTSALAGTDGPARGHDVAYYCDQITANIVALQGTAPPWAPLQIKQQLAGRLSSIIRL